MNNPAGRDSAPLALTQGDPAGIGPDLALKAWLCRSQFDLPAFAYVGDPDVLRSRALQLGLDVPIATCDIDQASGLFDLSLPVIALSAGGAVVAGMPDSATASGTIGAIRLAVDMTFSGQSSGLVTNPIAKSVLYEAGFGFPGHTEFLADLATLHTGKPVMPVMLLAGPLLKAVPVTIHIPIKDVAGTLTAELIEATCRITEHDLKSRFGISRPRLAVAGLNPHAGENGTMGEEDELIIRPAINALLAEGMDVTGPLPADTMFHPEARSRYDVAICMYHDQALIPAKALGFDDSVNVTLGLPFIRTSPDHGTAFSLAGTGQARANSLIAALLLAGKMSAANRDGLA